MITWEAKQCLVVMMGNEQQQKDVIVNALRNKNSIKFFEGCFLRYKRCSCPTYKAFICTSYPLKRIEDTITLVAIEGGHRDESLNRSYGSLD